jgi:hypothetical protein
VDGGGGIEAVVVDAAVAVAVAATGALAVGASGMPLDCCTAAPEAGRCACALDWGRGANNCAGDANPWAERGVLRVVAGRERAMWGELHEEANGEAKADRVKEPWDVPNDMSGVMVEMEDSEADGVNTAVVGRRSGDDGDGNRGEGARPMVIFSMPVNTTASSCKLRLVGRIWWAMKGLRTRKLVIF